MKKRMTGKGLVWLIYLQNLAMGLASVILFIPVALILVYIEQIGPWWVPLLFAYFTVFFTAQAFVLIPKHFTRLHHQLGSEMFYRMYPDEMKKALRRIRKIPQPEREQVIAEYRARLVDTETDIRNRRRSAASRIIYTAAALVVLALAVFCFYGLFREVQSGEKINLARVLRFVSAFLMLSVSVALFRKWSKMILQVITCVALFADIWANIANKLSVPTRYTMAPVWKGLIIMAIFIVAGIGFALIARRLNTRANTRRNRQEFDLALYQLDVIDEKELAYRMEKQPQRGISC